MISVVIPVFNEARSLADLHHRLAQTLKETGEAYEVVFVDDGSTDGSIEILRALHAQDRTVRVVRLNRNWGQHAAVLAGMERACGDVVVTLDADLQNPPEEIPRLPAALAAGPAVAGGGRGARAPAGARGRGRPRYGLFRLLRLCFDLLTGFSLLPIQVVSLTGMLVAVLGLAFGLFLGLRRLIVGPEVEGVFTLFAILFFFVGLQILALGLIGEYVGRIYQEVRRRPRYVVSEVLD